MSFDDSSDDEFVADESIVNPRYLFEVGLYFIEIELEIGGNAYD